MHCQKVLWTMNMLLPHYHVHSLDYVRHVGSIALHYTAETYFALTILQPTFIASE